MVKACIEREAVKKAKSTSNRGRKPKNTTELNRKRKKTAQEQ